MKTLILVISIWAMSYVAVAFAGEKKAPLSEVYCGFVLSEKTVDSTDGVTLGSFDERWEIFISYLESREVFSKVSETSEQKAAFDECVSKNKENFEMGEFALSGLESIEQTRSFLAKAAVSVPTAPALIASNINLLDREISTPDMEMVYGFIPEQASEDVPKESLENGVSERQERYAQLWKEFTLKLKDTYSMQQVAVPVITGELR